MNVLEWARRQRPNAPTGSVLEDLQEGCSNEEISTRRGMPLAFVEGTQTFYDALRQREEHPPCSGTACQFPRGRGGISLVRGGVHCLGQCYQPPAATDRPGRPIPVRALVDQPVVLRNLVGARTADWRSEYTLPDGDTVLERISNSGLRGRGGAAFPTAAKWRAARDTAAPRRYVVANGDEGDSGSFVDRLLLEEAPHEILAGMLACARAIGADQGVIYIRDEYPTARERMQRAITEASSAGLHGGFEVRIVSGAGSYVCGEETALLRSIEGLRGEPSPKPPYPAQSGLFGFPTVVQNVETLAVVPYIARGGAWNDPKAFCISGAVCNPGVVEAPLGITLTEVLERGADGPAEGATWKMALIGGPMGCVVPASAFDTPLEFATMPGLGHAGIVVLDDTVSAQALADHLYAFAQNESCGNCAPCRLGTAQLAQCTSRDQLERLLLTLEMGSLCGFGAYVPRPIRDLLQHFGEELFNA